MSITGPGCDKCNHTGMVPFTGNDLRSLVPCLACSPWTQDRSDGGVAVTLMEAAALVEASLPSCGDVLEIMRDPHMDTSLSVDAWMRLFDDPTEWATPVDRAVAIAANSVWLAVWCDKDGTPRRVAASSFAALVMRLSAEVSP